MASGDTLFHWRPAQAEPLQAAYAELSNRGSYPVLKFDDTSKETAIFTGWCDARKAGGNYRVKVIWASDAIIGSVVWGVSVARETANASSFATNLDNYAAQVTGTASANTTSGRLNYTAIDLSNAQFDAVAAGEQFRLRLQRVADNASDTLVGDAEVLGIVVEDLT